MELKVDIQIIPPPRELDARLMDEMLSGELANFEKWFIQRQRDRGLEAGGLISAERGVIKAYILFAATERREKAG